MIIYQLTRKDETLAIFSKDFCLTPYYLTSLNISSLEFLLIDAIAKDLCSDNLDFEEYSKYWLNDYKLKILRKD